jgi:hypothetical protein
MSAQTKTLDEVVGALTPEQRREVVDFAEFLLSRQGSPLRRQPQFSWAGALEDMRGRYTSVELQHAITEWRMGSE